MTQFVDDLLNVVGSDVDEEQVDRPGGGHEADLGALDPDGATLEVAVPEDVQILAVSRALRQLLENLLANAVDHGGTGVTVEVGLTEAGFYVEDDGPGSRPTIVDGSSSTASRPADRRRTRHRRGDRRTPRLGATRDRGRGGRRTVRVHSLSPADPGTAGPDRGRTRGPGRQAGRRRGGIERHPGVYAPVDGDCRIVGRVTDVEPVHEYGKAGVFVAHGGDHGAPEASSPADDGHAQDRRLGFVGATVAHGHEIAWRADPVEEAETRQVDDGEVVPHWYRIDRLGDRLTCYGSIDGEDWQVLGQHVLYLPETVLAGLAVNSHELGTTCEATFEDVRLVGLEDSSEGA